jgi:nucleotidyltransferase substrate binding protein (TIGR01987 family)
MTTEPPENRLDLTSLKAAAAAFGDALSYALRVEGKPEGSREPFEFEITRAALIHHFEFSYELCWKTMKRFIEMDIGEEADILSRRDLFRLAAERRLIEDFDRWLHYHRSRNRTSHTYNENVAKEVYQCAKDFNDDLRAFVGTMERRA